MSRCSENSTRKKDNNDLERSLLTSRLAVAEQLANEQTQAQSIKELYDQFKLTACGKPERISLGVSSDGWIVVPVPVAVQALPLRHAQVLTTPGTICSG